MSLLKKLTFINIFSKPRPFLKGRGKEHQFIVGLFLVSSVFLGTFLLILFGQNREATLLLAFEDEGKGRMFTGKVIGGMTILDALTVSANAGQIQLKYNVSADGKVVIYGLDGYNSNSNGKKITFYLNQIRIESELINLTRIKPGDSIEVRLE